MVALSKQVPKEMGRRGLIGGISEEEVVKYGFEFSASND